MLSSLQSRPPGIYKRHYLEELTQCYHGNIAEVHVPGVVPIVMCVCVGEGGGGGVECDLCPV